MSIVNKHFFQWSTILSSHWVLLTHSKRINTVGLIPTASIKKAPSCWMGLLFYSLYLMLALARMLR